MYACMHVCVNVCVNVCMCECMLYVVCMYVCNVCQCMCVFVAFVCCVCRYAKLHSKFTKLFEATVTKYLHDQGADEDQFYAECQACLTAIGSSRACLFLETIKKKTKICLLSCSRVHAAFAACFILVDRNLSVELFAHYLRTISTKSLCCGSSR